MSKATWDTGKAQRMWEAGYSDKDIAQEVGTTAASISYYRRKHWVDDTPPKEEQQREECDANEVAEHDPAEERSGSEALVCGKGSEEHHDHPEPEQKGSEDNRNMNRFEVMAAAVAGLSGIEAVCVAEAISALWSYTGEDDLLKAKAAIEYLLQVKQ